MISIGHWICAVWAKVDQDNEVDVTRDGEHHPSRRLSGIAFAHTEAEQGKRTVANRNIGVAEVCPLGDKSILALHIHPQGK